MDAQSPSLFLPTSMSLPWMRSHWWPWALTHTQNMTSCLAHSCVVSPLTSMTSADDTVQHYATKPNAHIFILSMPPPGSFRCSHWNTLSLASRACPVLLVFSSSSYRMVLHPPPGLALLSYSSLPDRPSLSDLWVLKYLSSYALCSGHLFHAQSFSYSFHTYVSTCNESRCCRGHRVHVVCVSCK